MARTASPPSTGSFRRRLVGLYALTLMEREGPLHGYGLSERISRQTDGAWRPGPGSVYPSLRKLADLGFARSTRGRHRREYTITPRGRALLRRIRHRNGPLRGPRPDVSSLWSEVMGAEDVGEFLVGRLRRAADAIESRLVQAAAPRSGTAALRRAALTELRRSTVRLRKARPSSEAIRHVVRSPDHR